MEDINLNEYFRRYVKDLKCPHDTCAVISASTAEYLTHLWSHKRSRAGRPLDTKDRHTKCPHPKCGGKTYRNVTKHVKEHTRKTNWICPHLVNWEGNARELCGFRADRCSLLYKHKVDVHGYNVGQQYALDPWVKCGDIMLSEAPYYFAVDGEDADNGNAPQAQPAPQNDAPAPQAIPGPVPHAHPGAPPANAMNQNVPPFAGGPHVHAHAYAHYGHAYPYAHAHPQLPPGHLTLNKVEVTRITDEFGRLVQRIEKRTYV